MGTMFAVAAGANHSVALAPQGAASGVASLWGDNTWGQIGDGTTDISKMTPVALKSSTLPVTTRWKTIAAGEAHTLAIRSDGTLWAWGRNDNGQLGNIPVGAGWNTPKQVGTLTTWTAVAAGDGHSVGMRSTSPQIWTWGRNAEGQLGLAAPTAVGNITTVTNYADVATPTSPTKSVTVVNSANVLNTMTYSTSAWAGIAANGKYTMAVRADGQMFSWGDNSSGQLGQTIAINTSLPTVVAPIGSGILPVVAMTAGRNHALAILNDHTLYAWGANEAGQLGIGASSNTGQGAAVQVGTDNNWFVVAAGGQHTLAIKQDQTLWAWGYNAYGQLGDGTQTDSPSPIPIGTSKRWLAVAAGRYHSMAIDTDGKLWVWGRNTEGQLGLGVTVGPVLVPTQLP